MRSVGYLLGAALVAALTLLKLAFPQLADGPPFLLFFGTVLLAAWRGGRGPGVLTAVLAAASAKFFFMKPAHTFAGDSTEALHVATFLVESFGITWVAEMMRTAQVAALESARAREQALLREREARERMHEAEKRWRTVLEDAPVAILVTEGPDHVVTFANASYQDLVGAHEVEGKPYRDALPEVDALGVGAIFDEVLSTGSSKAAREFRAYRDWKRVGVAEERFFDVTFKPMRVRPGRAPEGVLVALVDVTHEVRARREIERVAEERAQLLARAEEVRAEAERAEARMTRMFRSNLIGNVLWDDQGLVKDANDTFLSLTGYTRSDVEAGVRMGTLTAPELAEAASAHGRELLEKGMLQPLETKLRRKDGSLVPVLVAAAFYPDSRTEGFTYVVDLTEVKAAQAEAERERQRLRDVLENAPILMGITEGPEHRLAWANAAMRDLLGIAGRNVANRPVREALPELLPQGVPELLDGVFRTGERYLGTAVPLRLEEHGGLGETRYFSFVYEPMRGPNGEVTSVFVLSSEVTELVRARERESRARERAEEASRLKDEFLATLSHELRTPLNAIVGWASLLRGGRIGEAKVDRALETIERNARVQVRLIEDLLDVSRIVQGKLVFNVASVELTTAIDAAVQALVPTADAKQILLARSFDGPATIRGDADRMQQIVGNLVSNAIKFTPRGGHVDVRLRHVDAGDVELVVADDGQGIAPAFLPHVFDRFRQADSSSTRAYGGLGLGLAIVRSLVELHGGTVRAESAGIGHGARFVVRLPAIATAPAEAAPPPAGRGDDRLLLDGLRVLVVDDEPDARALIRYVLTQRGASVIDVESAAEAVAKVHAGALDVLISDIGMPNRSGLELIHDVRALPADQGGDLPAIALTAYARSEDRDATLRAGFDMYCAKPIEPAELAAAVSRAARARRRGGSEMGA